MDERDLKVQELTREAARWRNRALEACEAACFHCEEYVNDKKNCDKCRVKRIREAAGK